MIYKLLYIVIYNIILLILLSLPLLLYEFYAILSLNSYILTGSNCPLPRVVRDRLPLIFDKVTNASSSARL